MSPSHENENIAKRTFVYGNTFRRKSTVDKNFQLFKAENAKKSDENKKLKKDLEEALKNGSSGEESKKLKEEIEKLKEENDKLEKEIAKGSEHHRRGWRVPMRAAVGRQTYSELLLITKTIHPVS